MKRRTIPILLLLGSMFLSACGKEAVDNSIEVTFSWNFETERDNPNSIRVVPGGIYGVLPTPDFEREGFTFDGWNIRRDGKGDNVEATTQVDFDAIDHTLYAKWEGHEYTVSFDLHGGMVNGMDHLPDAKVKCGNIYGAMVIPQDPSKKLGTFLGWYLNAEGEGERITYSTKVSTPHNHTLHAVFKDIKLDYTFDNEKDLEDFKSIYDQVELKIANNSLEITNPSDDPRAYMAFHSSLKAGSAVSIDAEFVGNAPAEEGVRAGMYTYGLNSEDGGIYGGFRGDPGVPATREEVKNWYYGQGANNIQAWELEKWNNGHIKMNMNILEDCSGVYFMFDFGRKVDPDTQEIDLNPDLWQNNKWVIRSIHIDYADYDLLKDEYDFVNPSDADSFSHPQNVVYGYDESDSTLKISKGDTSDNSYLRFDTQYIAKGSRVKFEIIYYGDTTYSSDNTVGVFSYANYPNGKILDKKLNENGFDVLPALESDSPHLKYFYWGTYGATNEPWAPIKLVNGQKIIFENYLFEDAYGITLRFKFGTSNGYFKISNVKVEREEEIAEFDFSREKQLKYFTSSSSTKFELDGDEYADFLKVTKIGNETNFINLRRLIKKGQKVTFTLAYSTSDPVFVNGVNQFTFLVHKSGYNSQADGGALAVIGNAPWDGGWDSNEVEISFTVDADCYGFWMQFVFNNVPDSYFRILGISIE